MKTRKKFLITGHPRSGTTYLAKVMQQAGFHVKHEMLGKDGIASWMFTVDDYQEWKDLTLRRGDFEFDHVIVAIRDPMKMLASVRHTEQASINFRRRHLPEMPDKEPEQSMHSIMGWYAKLKSQRTDYWVKIEEPEYLLQVLRAEGYLIPTDLEPSRKVVNARQHPEITWEELEQQADKLTYQQWETFCMDTGYEIGGQKSEPEQKKDA